MKRFVELFVAVDETRRKEDKVDALARFFSEAQADDAAWALNLLLGNRPKRAISAEDLIPLASELAGVPSWLFAICHESVGDLTETVALLAPNSLGSSGDAHSLSWWMKERIVRFSGASVELRLEVLREAWSELDSNGRFVFNRLITGTFRVSVSHDMVVRAISMASGIDGAIISHRLSGEWKPTAAFFESLIAPEVHDATASRPYPFGSANPLEEEPSALGDIVCWHVEWNWGGARVQVIRREGKSFVWSDHGELIAHRFPELLEVCDDLPDGTVIDGQILALLDGTVQMSPELQKRVNRATSPKKAMERLSIVFVANDLFEYGGVDLRGAPFSERRKALVKLVASYSSLRARVDVNHPDLICFGSELILSTPFEVTNWSDLSFRLASARETLAEGLVLKRQDSHYPTGREHDSWWIWNAEPLRAIAVLMYAERGMGKDASTYASYTFGVWHLEALVPIAKMRLGLSEAEVREVDDFIKNNTLERFGPVRTVKPELVMELSFDNIQPSTRHKSGLTVTNPRVVGWLKEAKPEDADKLEKLKQM